MSESWCWRLDFVWGGDAHGGWGSSTDVRWVASAPSFLFFASACPLPATPTPPTPHPRHRERRTRRGLPLRRPRYVPYMAPASPPPQRSLRGERFLGFRKPVGGGGGRNPCPWGPHASLVPCRGRPQSPLSLQGGPRRIAMGMAALAPLPPNPWPSKLCVLARRPTPPPPRPFHPPHPTYPPTTHPPTGPRPPWLP